MTVVKQEPLMIYIKRFNSIYRISSFHFCLWFKVVNIRSYKSLP